MDDRWSIIRARCLRGRNICRVFQRDKGTLVEIRIHEYGNVPPPSRDMDGFCSRGAQPAETTPVS